MFYSRNIVSNSGLALYVTHISVILRERVEHVKSVHVHDRRVYAQLRAVRAAKQHKHVVSGFGTSSALAQTRLRSPATAVAVDSVAARTRRQRRVPPRDFDARLPTYTCSRWPMSCIRFAACCLYDSSLSASIPHSRLGVFWMRSFEKYQRFCVGSPAITEL